MKREKTETAHNNIKVDNTDIDIIKNGEGVFIGIKNIIESFGMDWIEHNFRMQKNGDKYGYMNALNITDNGGFEMISCINFNKIVDWVCSLSEGRKLRFDIVKKILDFRNSTIPKIDSYLFPGKTAPAVKENNSIQTNFEIPKTYKEALLAVVRQIDANEMLSKENDTLKADLETARPMIAFHETVNKTVNSISIREFAKVLNTPDLSIGEKRLFKLFYDNKVLLNDRPSEPYQKYIENGCFEVKERTYTNKKTQKEHTYRRVFVTGKGQTYFSKKIAEWTGHNKEIKA